MENPGLLSETSTVAKAVTIAQRFTAKTNVKSEWSKFPSGKKKNNVHKGLKK